ncbi:unnamed protein product [Trichobilharzia szidati]|nr:unnamed protein product [Trichobilharzia szidati]
MENMSPLIGLWEKLRMKLDRVTSNQASTSENHETQYNTNVDSGTTIPTTNGTSSSPVTVNVYDMLWINYYVSSLGIGVYHTGVVVHGTEYSYGGHPLTNSGIFAMLPKDSAYLGENYSYKLTLTIGYTDFTASDVNLLLESMTPDFSGDQYHLLHKNCNHFADAFVQILCGRSLPKWINRLATIAAKLPFIERSLPVEWLTPHQQFADQMNDQLDSESRQSPDEEHSIHSNTTAAGNSHSPFRRWSAIDRLQNSLLHRFHHNTTKYAKRPTTQNRHRRSLTTNAKYDTCSLFDLPSDENTVANDTDWYAFITAQSTTTLSEPNIISICRQQGVKNCSSDSSTSNPAAVVVCQSPTFSLGQPTSDIDSHECVALQRTNQNASNEEYYLPKNTRHKSLNSSHFDDETVSCKDSPSSITTTSSSSNQSEYSCKSCDDHAAATSLSTAFTNLVQLDNNNTHDNGSEINNYHYDKYISKSSSSPCYS